MLARDYRALDDARQRAVAILVGSSPVSLNTLTSAGTPVIIRSASQPHSLLVPLRIIRAALPMKFRLVEPPSIRDPVLVSMMTSYVAVNYYVILAYQTSPGWRGTLALLAGVLAGPAWYLVHLRPYRRFLAGVAAKSAEFRGQHSGAAGAIQAADDSWESLAHTAINLMDLQDGGPEWGALQASVGRMHAQAGRAELGRVAVERLEQIRRQLGT
jgi:hypothetical protein